MAVSYENSKIIFQGIKAAGIRSLSALPETWLGLLLQQAERDPEVTLIQVAKEEEAIGVAAGAYFAGTPHILLMQNHGSLRPSTASCRWRSCTAFPCACSSRSAAIGANRTRGTREAAW
jgi:sulfopyruvate decarboxylase TPP-binding subunit